MSCDKCLMFEYAELRGTLQAPSFFACRSYPDEAILADLQTLNILVLKTLRNITACDTSRVTLIFFFLLLCTFP